MSDDDMEPFVDVVARANEWARESSIRVINIETLLLPNVVDRKSGERRSASSVISTGEGWTRW